MKVQGGLCSAVRVAALHRYYPPLKHYTLASWQGGTQTHKLNAELWRCGAAFRIENNGVAGLTPSSPLVSCRLTVCSSCCSWLTVWSSPAVSLSFLSISSCQEGTVGSDCNVQNWSRDQTPWSALASYCLWCWAAIFNQSIGIVHHFGQLPLNQINRLLGLQKEPKSSTCYQREFDSQQRAQQKNKQKIITLYKSPATFCLSLSSVSNLDRVSVSCVLSCRKNTQLHSKMSGPQGDTSQRHLLYNTAWQRKRSFIQGLLPTLHTLNGSRQVLNVCTDSIVFFVSHLGHAQTKNSTVWNSASGCVGTSVLLQEAAKGCFITRKPEEHLGWSGGA